MRRDDIQLIPLPPDVSVYGAATLYDLYTAVVEGANHLVYVLPGVATHVLEVDPLVGVCRRIGSALSNEDALARASPLYEAGCTSSTGRIYAPPSNASYVLEVDPELGVVGFIGENHCQDVQGSLYKCIAEGCNGLLYSAPANATRILEIDPFSRAVRVFGQPLSSHMVKYSCMCAAGNGKIYAAPDCADYVLELDPITETVRFVGDCLGGGGLYLSLAAAPNGKLYAPPYFPGQVLEINPATGSVQLIGPYIDCEEGYHSIAVGSDSRLYCAPEKASKVLVIDTSVSMADTPPVRECGPAVSTSYVAMCAGSDKLYMLPSGGGNDIYCLEVDAQSGNTSACLVCLAEMLPQTKFSSIAAADSGRVLIAAPSAGSHLLAIRAAPASAAKHPLVGSMAAFAAGGKWTDVTICVGGEEFHGHRVILSRIPFFEAVFERGFSERDANAIAVHDLSAGVFAHVWHHMYTCDVAFVAKLDSAVLLEALEAAQRFELPELKLALARRMTQVAKGYLTVDTVERWMRASQLYNLPALRWAMHRVLRNLADARRRDAHIQRPVRISAQSMGRQW